MAWIHRHGLFAAALWVVLAAMAAEWSPLLWIPVSLAALGLGLVLRRPWQGVAWMLCIGVALGIGSWRASIQQDQTQRLARVASTTVAATALADARGDVNFWQVPVRLEEGPVGMGAKVWWQGRGEVPVEGSRLEALGRFELPEPPRNPGEFDRQRWLRQQGLLAIFRQQPHRPAEVETPAWARALAKSRAWVRSSITRGLEESSTGAKVIRAVVLGEKPREDEELLDDFRLSGSMHVFSVSGLHVGMVAVLVWLVAAYSGLSRRWLALPVVGVVFAYAWLTGANPPAVRAAWMAAVFLGAFCFRRRPDLANALGAVLLVLLLWDVHQLQQPGVQLSYGVVTAIAFGLPWTTRCFAWMAAAPMHMPVAEIGGPRRWWWRLRQWLATTLAVSTAASLGAAPLTAWHFGLVTPVSVIAALLMLPLVFVVMVLALTSVVLSPLPPATQVINPVNAWLATRCAQVAGSMADLPGGHWQLGQEEGPLLRVYDLDYGDGAIALLPGEWGGAVLIDCGGRYTFKHPLRASLQRLGIEVDSMVLTHPDGGHLGGGHAVWQDLPLRQVVMPVREARSPAHRAWVEQAPQQGVTLIDAAAVGGLPLGDEARLQWLHLPDPDAQNQPADHRVLVMRLHWQGWRILLMGDAGMTAERAMLESGRDLDADVLIADCHRDGLSLGDDFLAAVRPRVMILGRADDPELRQLRSGRIDHWRQAGMIVYDQGESGAVSLRPTADGLSIEGFVDGRRILLPTSSHGAR